MARILMMVALLALVAPAVQANTDIAPDELARSVTDEVLSIVRANKELQAGNPQKVAQLVEAKVLPHFNFTRMTQRAVGRNWRQASPEQQKTLIEEFKTLLVRTYATAFAQYRNQTVDYRPLRTGPGDTDVVVKSLIRQPTGQPIAIDYGMERVDGAWKVYDVKIEGISLVDNYRNTFSGEVQRGGIEGLIRTLSNKNKTLAAQWAQPS